MSDCCHHLCFCVAVARIFCFRACCRPCRPKAAPRPSVIEPRGAIFLVTLLFAQFDVLCLGLDGAGKSAVLAALCNEPFAGLSPTTGFSIKAVPLSRAVFNVKDLPGSAVYREYWPHYFDNMQAVIFVVNVSTAARMSEAFDALESVHRDPRLVNLPVLLLVTGVGEGTLPPDFASAAFGTKAPPSHLLVATADPADLARLRATFEMFAEQFGFYDVNLHIQNQS